MEIMKGSILSYTSHDFNQKQWTQPSYYPHYIICVISLLNHPSIPFFIHYLLLVRKSEKTFTYRNPFFSSWTSLSFCLESHWNIQFKIKKVLKCCNRWCGFAQVTDTNLMSINQENDMLWHWEWTVQWLS